VFAELVPVNWTVPALAELPWTAGQVVSWHVPAGGKSMHVVVAFGMKRAV
jgi:hypothetical protein